MDILATFPDTLSVLHAEQILTRRGIPFETVPRTRFDRQHCGLGILFSEEYLEKAKAALDEAGLATDFTRPNEPTP